MASRTYKNWGGFLDPILAKDAELKQGLRSVFYLVYILVLKPWLCNREYIIWFFMFLRGKKKGKKEGEKNAVGKSRISSQYPSLCMEITLVCNDRPFYWTHIIIFYEANKDKCKATLTDTNIQKTWCYNLPLNRCRNSPGLLAWYPAVHCPHSHHSHQGDSLLMQPVTHQVW